jgi:HEAT repeat protein
MGAKTLPFLLADLADKNSNNNRYSQVTWAFDALGPIGIPAIPKLVKLKEQNPGYVPGALAGIGRDALPDLLNALTNGSFWVRDNTAAYLANAIYSGKISSTEASAAFQIAIENLQFDSTNTLFRGNTRWRAASLLGALKLEPDISVPALIKGMEDTNISVAGECALALGQFGNQAKSAIPVLTKASSSTNSFLSRTASFSLGMITRKQ